MKAFVEVNHFTKQFGSFTAVDDLSFTVEQGEILAFLGANGSGKTTTIRALLGIYPATSGTLLIGGQPYSNALAPLLGYLPEERGLYLDAKVLELLVYFGELKGLSRLEAAKRAQVYLEKVDLADKAKVAIKKLSSGQQQKIQLGAATINNPKLLVLDEPTKGLDPINRALLLERLEELHRSGSTIIYTTHQLEEIERLQTGRVLIIKEGKRAAFGSPTELKRQHKAKSIDDVFMRVYEGV